MPIYFDPACIPNIQRYSDYINYFATLRRLPPLLVAAVIGAESCGDNSAYYPGHPCRLNIDSGAVGLMQVMPRDNYIAPWNNISGRPSTTELCSPSTNIAWGCAILREYINRYGGNANDPVTQERALGDYGVLGSPGGKRPESQRAEYVRAVITGYQYLSALPSPPLPPPPTPPPPIPPETGQQLDIWPVVFMAAGGLLLLYILR